MLEALRVTTTAGVHVVEGPQTGLMAYRLQPGVQFRRETRYVMSNGMVSLIYILQLLLKSMFSSSPLSNKKTTLYITFNAPCTSQYLIFGTHYFFKM